MRWARRHLELTWPGGGPRWHLILDSHAGELVGACQRPVLSPFEIVPETPSGMRCHSCDGQAGLGTPNATDADMGDSRRDLLALRAIVVTGRNAVHKAAPEDRARIRARVMELLVGLEAEIRRAGADEEVLSSVEEARREFSHADEPPLSRPG